MSSLQSVGLVHLEALIPTSDRFVYDGSLTTPPCTENVTWILFAQPLAITQDQLSRFRHYYSKKYRPLQKEHLRRVYLAH